MKKEDIEFRKYCQKYNDMVRKLIKQGKTKEAAQIIQSVAKYLKDWEEYKRSINIKFNALRSLYASITLEHRKSIKK